MKALLAASLLVLLALAGCSGSGGDGTVPRQDDEGRYVIEMTSGNKFSPAVAQVPVGSTVVWVHEGGAPHDVQGEGFSSGPTAGMSEGEEYPHTFDEEGRFEYHCEVHKGSGMKGTIVVTDEA